MQLHELKSPFGKRNIKRIGRGGKRGTYSGKGQKGQKSRAGHRIRPALRDLVSKLPKFRGVKNKSIYSRPVVVNIGDLEKKMKDDTVNKKTLALSGLIKENAKNIKILGDGKLTRKLKIEGIKLSATAREKVLKAHGSVK